MRGLFFVLGGALLAGSPVACGLETGGLSLSGATGAAGSPATTASSGSTGGSSTAGPGSPSGGRGGAVASSSSAGAGTPDAGAADAGTIDAATEAGPTTYASCAAILAAHPLATSNVYDLVDGAQQPYQAFCEMTGDGGGWTLALKIDGNQSTFPYDASYWTGDTGLNLDKPDLDTTEAQLPSYWSVPFTAMRVGMIDQGTTRWLVVPAQGSSLLDLVESGGTTSAGRGAWEGLLKSGSLQTSCNWEGFDPQSHVRIGIVGDESVNCGTSPSPDSFIGFGATSSFGAPSGNTAHWYPDHGDQDTKTFGYVMIR